MKKQIERYKIKKNVREGNWLYATELINNSKHISIAEKAKYIETIVKYSDLDTCTCETLFNNLFSKSYTGTLQKILKSARKIVENPGKIKEQERLETIEYFIESFKGSYSAYPSNDPVKEISRWKKEKISFIEGFEKRLQSQVDLKNKIDLSTLLEKGVNSHRFYWNTSSKGENSIVTLFNSRNKFYFDEQHKSLS